MAGRGQPALSGRTHLALSAVCCVDRGREAERLCVSRVRFARLEPARIAAYVATVKSGEFPGPEHCIA